MGGCVEAHDVAAASSESKQAPQGGELPRGEKVLSVMRQPRPVTYCIRLAALLLAIPAAAIGLVACGSGSTTTVTDATTVVETTTTAAPPANTPPAGSESGLTTSQKNAVRAAQSYLSISAFSKLGLIRQLSSSAGDGYSVEDATAAVNDLQVDWNAQAAKAAKAYLDISPFSCAGLVQQLSSSAGDQYTTAQATYGAKQAGVC
jgi:hypothetical protein